MRATLLAAALFAPFIAAVVQAESSTLVRFERGSPQEAGAPPHPAASTHGGQHRSPAALEEVDALNASDHKLKAASKKASGAGPGCRENFLNALLEDYRGCQDHAVTGAKCQDWKDFLDKVSPINLGDDPQNFCRNPGGVHPRGIWCFTSPEGAWEYCDVRAPIECDELMHGEKSTLYRGCQDITISGKKCQKWTDVKPHEHIYGGAEYNGMGLSSGPFCRNPGGSQATIWCYTEDPQVRWEVCTPKAYAGEVTSTLPIAFNPVLMQEGAKAWTDRNNYMYQGVPQELLGATLYQGPHDITTPGTITVKANHIGATVYVFSEHDALVNKHMKTCNYDKTLVPSGGWLEAELKNFWYNAGERRDFKVWRYDLAPKTSITWITGSASGCVGGFVVREQNPQGGRGGPGEQGQPGERGDTGPDGPEGPQQEFVISDVGLTTWSIYGGMVGANLLIIMVVNVSLCMKLAAAKERCKQQAADAAQRDAAADVAADAAGGAANTAET